MRLYRLAVATIVYTSPCRVFDGVREASCRTTGAKLNA